MHTIRLSSATDFDGWRSSARTLLMRGVEPRDVVWTDKSSSDLFDAMQGERRENLTTTAFSVPRTFLDLAQTVSLHRDAGRFSLLYRTLWRLQSEPRLLEVSVDEDVARVRSMAKAVRRDIHKMRAFVRFRRTEIDHRDWFVAWFEPAHHIVEANSPFFVRRFASMRWSILTPEVAAHWNGENLTFGEGAHRNDAPAEDAMEDVWRGYYASIFNPARLKVSAMRAEMPVRYWKNLPESRLIAPLVKEAALRSSSFVAEGPKPANLKPQQRVAMPADSYVPPGTHVALRTEAAGCRSCPLWQPATQTVFGEGRVNAPIMFVGEQPGDQEDIEGKAFVGPAGQVFDSALKEAGIDRSLTYVTNAVKHFKFQPRGKRRIHQRPNAQEIQHCRFWLDREIVLVKPRLIVMLGATAAQSIFGKALKVSDWRGKIIPLQAFGCDGLVTVHPSYLLRLPEAAAREQNFRQFVEDLKSAAARVDWVAHSGRPISLEAS